MKRSPPPDHTIRVTYHHGSSQPVYTVAVFRVCGSKAEAQAFVKAARNRSRQRSK